jgi:phage terminase large subunit
VFAGLDLGFRDPTAMCVIAFNWEDEKFYILDEYLDNEEVTSGHAKNIRALMDKWNIDYIYIDSANQQQRYDFAQEYDIPTTNAKKSLLDGIGYVASLADNDRIIIDPELKHVLYATDQYQWDPNQSLQKEKPLHNEASHMADAIRYALYSYKTSAGGF